MMFSTQEGGFAAGPEDQDKHEQRARGKDPLRKGTGLPSGFLCRERPRSMIPKPPTSHCSATPWLGEVGLGSATLVWMVGPNTRDLLPSIGAKGQPNTNELEWQREGLG